MEKFYSSKAFLKMAGGGMHPPYPPLDPPLKNGSFYWMITYFPIVPSVPTLLAQ